MIKGVLVSSSVLCSIVIIVSISTTNWIVDTSESSVKSGIWKGCTFANKCESYGTKASIWDVIMQTFSALACVFAICGVVVSLIFFCFKSVENLTMLLLILSILSALCMISVVVITINKTHRNESVKFGWSFYLGWIGAGFCVITGVSAPFVEELLKRKLNTDEWFSHYGNTAIHSAYFV